jgi:hypothetical protein
MHPLAKAMHPIVELDMFLKDEPTLVEAPPPSPPPPVPEVIEDYQAQRARIIAQARELERLRAEVRGTAEREAAAIVAAARRDVREVLLEARRQLLVLVAQVQAVGCDPEAGELPATVVRPEVNTTSASLPFRSESPQEAPEDRVDTTNEVVSTARVQVREVLFEAQSELVKLSEEARELRARVAQPPHTSIATETETVAAGVEPEEPIQLSEPAEAPQASEPEVSFVAEPDAIYEPEPFTIEPAADPLGAQASQRVWIAAGATAVLVLLGVALYLSFGDRPGTAASGGRAAAAVPAANVEATAKPGGVPSSTPASAAPAAKAPLALTLSARRDVWVRSTIDGRQTANQLLKQGTTQELTANRDISVRAGDAGALLVSHNGAAARPFGGNGQPLTRRFAADAPPAPAERAPAVAQTASARPPRNQAPTEQRAGGGPAGTQQLSPATAAAGIAVPDANQTSAAEREILRITRRWFEAYFQGDPNGMAQVATDDFSIADQRGERLPTTMTEVERSMQQVRIEVAGDGAVLSARLTERAVVGGKPRQYVSLVSGVWIRKDGQWRLMGMRFVDPASVSPMRP